MSDPGAALRGGGVAGHAGGPRPAPGTHVTEAPAPGGAPARAAGGDDPPAAGLDREAIARILAAARFKTDGVLLETEGLALLDAMGIATPRRIEVASAVAVAALADPPLAGERVVVKAVGPDLLHKTEAGAVRVVANRRAAIADAISALSRSLARRRVAGFVVCEFVPHDHALGHELLLGLRWTREFGPVVTLGPGGIHAEFLVGALGQPGGLAAFAPCLAGEERIEEALARLVPARLVSESRRGQPPELPRSEIAYAVGRFLELASAFSPEPIAEFEVNPLVVSGGRLVALDALLKLTGERTEPAAPRPIDKLQHLLEPRSIAVVGVSEKMNPGRIILQNILRSGFDPGNLFVVKPGLGMLDGCRCVPSLSDLEGRMDLIVLSVSATQSAALLADIADHRRAESVVLIAGGLEEKPGTEALVGRMRDSLARARREPWRGPIVNGGNCLGIQSAPGRYNTLFIPEHKLPAAADRPGPVALIAGSGAFAVSKLSKLGRLSPRYTITIGNQMDLTAGDYLRYLADDAAVEVFAVYLEGLRALDGADFLRAAAEITQSGRTVILYRAGRTAAGAAAAASHTAAVAGDAVVGRALAEAAGVVQADTLEDFEDLVRLFTLLRGRDPRGLGLGAVTNAGFESVAIADHLGPFHLSRWSDATVAAMRRTLERARLADIVATGNPIDLTPILDDAGYEAIVRAALSDPGVDAGVVGCVPLTGALHTLAPSADHCEDVAREDGIVARLLRLRDETPKPWVAVVDAGRLYDPMAHRLEDGGVPTFRAADRAMRLFGAWCERRALSRI